jgi:hypothetical protein
VGFEPTIAALERAKTVTEDQCRPIETADAVTMSNTVLIAVVKTNFQTFNKHMMGIGYFSNNVKCMQCTNIAEKDTRINYITKTNYTAKISYGVKLGY